MIYYIKGGTAGGWTHILRKDTNMPVALVHPDHVSKFLAIPDLYEALKALYLVTRRVSYTQNELAHANEALAKAEK